MIVLGVDPGLDATGYAVVDVSMQRIIDAGLIHTQSARPLAERLVDIGAGLNEVLDEHASDLLAVEDLYSHYRHPRTAILMGHARGVVLLTAAGRRIETMSIPATQVKKSLTGNGHASKMQIQQAVMATLKLSAPPEPADVADAIAIAMSAGVLRADAVRCVTALNAGTRAGRDLKTAGAASAPGAKPR